jgi:hypothetical protein
MKFFIPHAENEAQAEEVYAGIKRIVLKETLNETIKERRIYSIRFRHDGVNYVATVGDIFERLGEPVIALLEGTALFHLCTPSRAVVKGGPYFIGREEVTSITEFDNEPGATQPKP